MPTEVHIASLVVLSRPERCRAVRKTIDAWPDAEVPIADPAGKLVVALETDSEHRILQLIDDINTIEGVLAAHLVYHQCEDAATLGEEIDHADHTP